MNVAAPTLREALLLDLERHVVMGESRTLAPDEIALLLDAPPVPMRIVCEGCGQLHIDEGEFATRAHHSHSCQHCGLTWRPAIVSTVGVRFLPGFKNEPQRGGTEQQ